MTSGIIGYWYGMDDTTRALDDLLTPGSTLMVATWNPDIGSRPLTVTHVGDRRIDILIDVEEEWTAAFTDGDRVHATLSDNRSNTWATVDGTGSLHRDRALIDDLWNPAAAAFFDDGRDTPGLAVFAIHVEHGRYWSTPSGRIGTAISVVARRAGRQRGERRSGRHLGLGLIAPQRSMSTSTAYRCVGRVCANAHGHQPRSTRDV